MISSTERNRALHFRNLNVLLPAILVLLSAFAFGQAESDPWLILPSGLTGRLNECTSHKDLVRIFGASNVTEKDGVEPFSGDMEYSTVLFPKDPQLSVKVLWRDDKKTVPSWVTVSGQKSRWRAVHNISLGISLKELERLNGRSFRLSPYDWDHPGRTVETWNNGRLAADLDGGYGQVWLTVSVPDPGVKIGNSQLSSDEPALQNINPRVYEVSWEFPSWEQKQCLAAQAH